jgi:hypothetical protein
LFGVRKGFRFESEKCGKFGLRMAEQIFKASFYL